MTGAKVWFRGASYLKIDEHFREKRI